MIFDNLYSILNIMNSMPLDLISAFISYGRAQNISVAAKNMKISQPSLSRYLQQFEEHCGEKIFIQEGRQKKLTALGEQLLVQLSRHWVNYDDIIVSTVSALNLAPKEPLNLYGPMDWLGRVCLKTQFKIVINRKYAPQPSQFGLKFLTELAKVPRLLFRADANNSDFAKYAPKIVFNNFLVIPNWSILIELVNQGRGWAVIPSDVILDHKKTHQSFMSSNLIIDIPTAVVPNQKYYLVYKKENRKISWFSEFLNEIQTTHE